ncbi:DUF4177 domain-containing protein [Lewinella sp. W8]|uniref:DUF4177 domain-containing protein n=1 Tax=Lewinella sp. W8 TaxID=2528208 RepID=UPI001067511B|nr:DUF4177 domain-containing protein [Lewinella sp. W8]MTB52817.1 DUF4177 domain-containing protein [Lewinella sp. W8]
MPNFEYKSIIVSGKFRDDADLVHLDKNINSAAEKGWELVSTTAVAHNLWDHGKTSGIVLTFRRPIMVPDNT